MRRILLFATLAAASLAALTVPGSALATNECNGLDVCISVPGPWVSVAGSPGGRLRTVEYQLACPRGSIAGGLDAVIGDEALGVRFLGSLGSPVNPGISTGRAVVFVAWWAKRAPTGLPPDPRLHPDLGRRRPLDHGDRTEEGLAAGAARSRGPRAGGRGDDAPRLVSRR